MSQSRLALMCLLAMESSSDEEDLLLLLALAEEEKKNNRRNRKRKRLAKLRTVPQTSTSDDSEPSTSTASNVKIEHVDVEQLLSSSEETESSDNPSMEFLPESDDQPESTTQQLRKSVTSKDAKTYCRLCLKPATKNQMVCLGDYHDLNYPSRTVQFKRNKVLQTEMYLRMIRMLMPDFDHDLVFNPIMCNNCSSRLQQASDFVEECMSNQKLMQHYRSTFCPNKTMVSCEEFIQNKSQVSEKVIPQNPMKKRKISTKSTPAAVELVREPSAPILHEESVLPTEIAIKTEIEEFEVDTKYEITPEEMNIIKQELETAEEHLSRVAESSEKLPSPETIVKTEPASLNAFYHNATEHNSTELILKSEIPCEVNPARSSNSVVGVALVPIQFRPIIQTLEPQTFVGVTPATIGNVSSAENPPGDSLDN